MESRGLQPDAELEQLAGLETRRRRLIPEIEGLKREQNSAADEVARAKRQGLDATPIFAAAISNRSSRSSPGVTRGLRVAPMASS